MASFCTRSSPNVTTGLWMLVAMSVVVLASPAQDDGVLHALRWKGISPQYEHFDHIRPVLVNPGNRSVFLSPIWPYGAARLQRFNGTDENWESGEWSKTLLSRSRGPRIPSGQYKCSGNSQPTTGRSRAISWRLSREPFPLEGRHRLLLRYSLSPWTLVHRPGTVYTTISPEFSVFE